MENTKANPEPETQHKGNLIDSLMAIVECNEKKAPELPEESDMEMDRR